MFNDIDENLLTEFNIDYTLLFHIVTLNTINYIFYNINYFLTQFKNTVKSSEGLRVCFISIFIATVLTLYEILLFYAFVIPEIKREVNEGILLLALQVKEQLYFNININLNNNIKDNLNGSNTTSIFFNLIDYLNITIPYLDTNTNSIINLNKYNKEYYDTYLSFINTFISSNFNEFLKYIINNETLKIFVLSTLKTLNVRESIYVDKINTYTVLTSMFLLGFLIFSLLMIKYTLNDRKEILGNYVWVSSWFTIAMILLFQYSFFVYANKYKYMGRTDTDEIVYFLFNQLQ